MTNNPVRKMATVSNAFFIYTLHQSTDNICSLFPTLIVRRPAMSVIYYSVQECHQ